MPCCHIPTPENPAFPNSLIPDVESFAKYVGGAPLGGFGNPNARGTLTSALHLEMKLWEPTEFTWYINDSQRNAWGVMSNRTTAPANVFPRFVQIRQCLIFSSFVLPPCADDCCLLAFDAWLLSKLVELRNEGLSHAGLHAWEAGQEKPPELGTIGLAQKLINIFLKYEICWQAVGQWENGQLVPYHPAAIPNLSSYLCALHAPIDRILLDALGSLALGKWLKKTKLFNLVTCQLKQSSDGSFRPWSKLDCLRTYYGLQLMLRKVAMRTWKPGCACAESTNAAIQKCAGWFNQTYGNEHPSSPNQPDWIQAACDLPETAMTQVPQVLPPTNLIRAGKNLNLTKQRPPSQFNQTPKGPKPTQRPVKHTDNKQRKMLLLSQLHENDKAITFKERCDNRWNLGWLCWRHGQLDLKVNGAPNVDRYLIGEIADAGGNFTTEQGYTENTASKTHCCEGAGYQGGVLFGSVEDAVKYLKQYFSVQACPGNRGLHGHPTCNQQWIDAL